MKRVYVVGPSPNDEHHDEDEYLRAYAALEKAGYRVVPQPANWSLRLEFATVITCDAVALLDVWWASTSASMTQAIVSWLQMPQLDAQTGRPMPTTKCRA